MRDKEIAFRWIERNGAFFVQCRLRWPGRDDETRETGPFATEGDAEAECRRLVEAFERESGARRVHGIGDA